MDRAPVMPAEVLCINPISNAREQQGVRAGFC
jgi:hypothetical protein